MKKILSVCILFLASVTCIFSQEQMSLSFSKNSSGELILTVAGHTSPVVVSAGDNKVTLHVVENKVNLTALGINDLAYVSVEKADISSNAQNESVEETDTAAGTESSSSIDTQVPIPPVGVSINPNPPLATPY